MFCRFNYHSKLLVSPAASYLLVLFLRRAQGENCLTRRISCSFDLTLKIKTAVAISVEIIPENEWCSVQTVALSIFTLAVSPSSLLFSLTLFDCDSDSVARHIPRGPVQRSCWDSAGPTGPTRVGLILVVPLSLPTYQHQ